MVSVKRLASAAVRWTAVSSGAVAVIQFVQYALLARLLLPSDIGLAAMVMVTLGLAQAYGDLGLGSAVIQRQDTTFAQLSSLYWLNLMAGITVSAVLYAATPLVAAMFGELRLVPLLHMASALLLVMPLGQQFQILLQKTMRFRTLAFVDIGSALAGAIIAVGAAWDGYGAYALVFGQLTVGLLTALGYFAVGWHCRWLPAAHFKRQDLKGYIRFGAFQMGDRTLNYLASRCDQLLIGMLAGPIALGYYNLAWNLVAQPISKINPILTRVAFPAFALMQNEVVRLKRGYLTVVWFLATVNAPLLFGCAATASTFIPLLFGERWLPAVPIVMILSFVSMARSVLNPVGSLLLAKGRADLSFYWTLVVFCTQVVGIYAGVRMGGAVGTAWAVLMLQLFYIVPSYCFLIRPVLGLCAGSYALSQLPAVAMSAVTAGMIVLLHAIPGVSRIVLLALQIATGIVAYGSLLFVFDRRRVREARGLLAHPPV